MEKRKVGRPKLKSPSDSKRRPRHSVQAYIDEWEVIQKFVTCVKKDKMLAKEIFRNCIE